MGSDSKLERWAIPASVICEQHLHIKGRNPCQLYCGLGCRQNTSSVTKEEQEIGDQTSSDQSKSLDFCQLLGRKSSF